MGCSPIQLDLPDPPVLASSPWGQGGFLNPPNGRGRRRVIHARTVGRMDAADKPTGTY